MGVWSLPSKSSDMNVSKITVKWSKTFIMLYFCSKHLNRSYVTYRLSTNISYIAYRLSTNISYIAYPSFCLSVILAVPVCCHSHIPNPISHSCPLTNPIRDKEKDLCNFFIKTSFTESERVQCSGQVLRHFIVL